MSKDIKLFSTCDHNVSGVRYESDFCPRCYGKGFYFDICFDVTGVPVLSQDGVKLQQEIIKIMVEDKGSNIFHPNWGNDISDRIIGNKNLPFMSTKIELIIRQVLSYLQSVQTGENQIWDNMTPAEILSSVESIDVIPLGQTGYQVKIKIKNKLDQIFSQSLII